MSGRFPNGPALSRLGVQLMLAILIAIGAVGLSNGQDTETEFVVIVHADNPATSVDQDRLSKMFLKKIKRWEDSEISVEAFDQMESTDVREVFTRSVHGKSISAIKSFWQRMIFSGRDVPPDELDSDAEVISAVADDEGGVGYVSAATELTDGVKTIDVTDK